MDWSTAISSQRQIESYSIYGFQYLVDNAGLIRDYECEDYTIFSIIIEKQPTQYYCRFFIEYSSGKSNEIHEFFAIDFNDLIMRLYRDKYLIIWFEITDITNITGNPDQVIALDFIFTDNEDGHL